MNSTLTVSQRVAVFLLSIDTDLAAEILRHVSDDRVDEISRAMRELQELDVDHDAVRDVFDDFAVRLRDRGLALGDVSGHAESVLVRAFGPERGHNVVDRARQEILARRPFTMFESIEARDLAGLLTNEHPQIAAVFLAHLDRRKAGQVLERVDYGLRADLVHRVSLLDRTPPDLVQRVLEVMRDKVRNLGLMVSRSEPGSWAKAAAQILNSMGPSGSAILDEIEERDAGIADRIRDEMLTFEDLSMIDSRSMQVILASVQTRQLALALKAAPRAVEESVTRNLSSRADAMLKEEREVLGPTPLSEVLAAQQLILALVRQLVERGEIMIGGMSERLVE